MDLGTIDEILIPTVRSDLPPGRPDTAVIAGGTWLLSEKQDHLRRLVDLTALGWTPLTESEDGLEIAATCTIETLASARFDRHWPATELIHPCATALLASFKIWTVATVGGNIAMALPAGAMISLTAALDGEALIWTDTGTDYRIPIVDLVAGPHENSLAAGDVLRSISLPVRALTARTAIRKIALSPLGRSASIVIGRLDTDGQFVLTVSAATVRPYVLRFGAVPTPTELIESLAATIPDASWYDDPHGAPDWRRHISTGSALQIREELS